MIAPLALPPILSVSTLGLMTPIGLILVVHPVPYFLMERRGHRHNPRMVAIARIAVGMRIQVPQVALDFPEAENDINQVRHLI